MGGKANRLAAEQAALRRVATLVASSAQPRQVFQMVAESVEAAVYYLVAESLTNTAKHAEASEARVEMTNADEEVVVTIGDNGSGGASADRGSGLRGLADRIEALGGRFELVSPSGGGTLVRATLPLG